MATPADTLTAAHALSACGQIVRKFDNDRFLTCLFAPADRREGLFALYAFNVEIAKTREVVTEPMLGQIRLQWWRESIDGIHDGTERRHEVIQPLAEAIRRHGLDRDYLDRMIDGREEDLDDEPPETLDRLVDYADATAVPLVLLALQVLDARTPEAVEAGRHVGIAWSLTGLLRAVPFHAASHRLYLPADLLDRHGVKRSRLFDGKPDPGLSTVVGEVAARARTHLSAARALRRRVPKTALPALLPATLASLYLKTLNRAGHDVFAPRVRMTHPLRQLRLGWNALTGRY